MNFIAVIMTPLIVFWQKPGENYCSIFIQMQLTIVYVILLNRTGMIDVSNVSMETHINQTIVPLLALLFNLSLRDVSIEIKILFLSDFSESARSVISLAIWLDVLLEFKSLVLQCNIMWSGSKPRTVGFQLTLAELNGQTLARHLWFSFRVSKKPFDFLYHSPSKYENSFFWDWWRRGAINFNVSNTFIIAIVFIYITIIIVVFIVIVKVIIFFRFLTSKSNIRIISFICSCNITTVIFRGWRLLIKKRFTIFLIIVIFIIIIISMIIILL